MYKGNTVDGRSGSRTRSVLLISLSFFDEARWLNLPMVDGEMVARFHHVSLFSKGYKGASSSCSMDGCSDAYVHVYDV